VKNFENRLRINRVATLSLVSPFFGTWCIQDSMVGKSFRVPSFLEIGQFCSSKIRISGGSISTVILAAVSIQYRLMTDGHTYARLYVFIFIHQAGSNINNNSNGKLNYKHLIKCYKLLQNWQKPFTLEIYRNINLSYLLLRTQLGRSIAK